jgi:hypothetical protein
MFVWLQPFNFHASVISSAHLMAVDLAQCRHYLLVLPMDLILRKFLCRIAAWNEERSLHITLKII